MPIDFASIATVALLAGGHVSDGGGLAEAHIAYSYLALDKFSQICQTKSDCAINPDEVSFLKNLTAVTAQERRLINPIFKSEKADPGFFLVRGVEQTYKATTQINQPIYFNVDRIYKTDGNGTATVLPLPTLIGVVAKAFSAHAPTSKLSDDQINQLCDRLGTINWKNLIETHAPTNLFAPAMGAVMYAEKRSDQGLFDLYLSDFSSAFNYSESFRKDVESAVLSTKTDNIISSIFLQGRWTDQAFHGDRIDMKYVVKFQTTVRSQDLSTHFYDCSDSLSTLLVAKNRQDQQSPYYLDPKSTAWSKANCTEREE